MGAKVTLIRHCKVRGSWKRLPIAIGRSGRLRPDYVVLNGTDIHSPDGHYEVRWYEGRRTRYKNVGTDLKDGLLARDQQERLLAATEAAELAGTKLVAEDLRRRLKAEFASFIEAARSRNAREIVQISERIGRKFLQESDCVFTDEVGAEHTTKFLQRLRSSGLSDRTCSNQWQHLKSMLKAAGVEVATVMPTAPRYERTLPEVYTDEELGAFFGSLTTDHDKLLFGLLYQTGLREQEAMHLSWSDLRLGESPTLTVRSKPDVGFRIKDGEERAIPLPSGLVEMLHARRKVRPKDRWVLGTSSDKPNGHFLRLLKRLVKKAGLNCGACTGCQKTGECKHWILHRFRATYATTLLRNGMDLRTVQHMMGHSDIESTMRYLRPQEMPERQRMINTVFAAKL